MNVQQNLDSAHQLITQAATKIEELCQHPEYETIAKQIKDKTPISLIDVLATLNNLAAVVNIQRF